MQVVRVGCTCRCCTRRPCHPGLALASEILNAHPEYVGAAFTGNAIEVHLTVALVTD